MALGWLSADRNHFLGLTFFVFTNLFGFCDEKLRKGACNVLVLNKKGSPVVPVAGVPVLGVQALAVVVGLISDIENAIHQLGTQFGALLFLKLLFVAFQLTRALNHLINATFAGLAHLINELILLDYGGFSV